MKLVHVQLAQQEYSWAVIKAQVVWLPERSFHKGNDHISITLPNSTTTLPNSLHHTSKFNPPGLNSLLNVQMDDM